MILFFEIGCDPSSLLTPQTVHRSIPLVQPAFEKEICINSFLKDFLFLAFAVGSILIDLSSPVLTRWTKSPWHALSRSWAAPDLKDNVPKWKWSSWANRTAKSSATWKDPCEREISSPCSNRSVKLEDWDKWFWTWITLLDLCSLVYYEGVIDKNINKASCSILLMSLPSIISSFSPR